jgi:hypothetical protein
MWTTCQRLPCAVRGWHGSNSHVPQSTASRQVSRDLTQ